MGTERQINKMCKAAERAGASGLGTLLNTIIDKLNNHILSDQVLPTQAGLGATLAIDANAWDAQTSTVINIMLDGVVYSVAVTAALDISGVIAQSSTVVQDKFGALWIYANRAGTLDVEPDKAAQDYATLVEAVAAFSTAALTLPMANSVCIGLITVEENNSGTFTWGDGAGSLSDEGGVFISFEGLPQIVTALADLTFEAANPEDFLYGAGVSKNANGTIVTISGETDSCTIAGTIQHGATGAWVLYVLADDVYWALPISMTYLSEVAAKAAVAALPKNPYIPEMGAIYVTNKSNAAFVGGTNELNATGIETTFVINPARSEGITALT